MTATTPATKDPAASQPRTASSADEKGGERTILVHLKLPGIGDQEDLEELGLLAESAGAFVCDISESRRQRPDAATFIGSGKAEEIADLVKQNNVALVLVNHALSPAQERNLERILNCRVLDRTGLILDIFAQRARSHEGKLQVELAQLEHLSTRLVRGWTHLERQKGGIGLRGPGETQLETDRRLLRARIKHLNKRLAKVQRQRRNRRNARNKIPIPTISLVGYTNAGKSSLFNRMTRADVYVADQLFATLDPTMRRLELDGNSTVILADTVGFIRHLPHDLVEAFKSTLEEVTQSDLLIHVVDGHNAEADEHIVRVNEVLQEIGAESVSQILLYNKIDLTGQAPRCVCKGGRTTIWLSAHSGEGVDLLEQALADHYRRFRQLRMLQLPSSAGSLRARLYEQLEILSDEAVEDGWRLEIAATAEQFAWLRKQADFNPSYLISEPETVLAPTGS